MSTTRGRDRDARKNAVAWRSLPTEPLLEICSFLDPKALGRLEIVGRVDGISRAWESKANGVARGALGPMSSKRLVTAHARMRSLYPMDSSEAFQGIARPPPLDFDEFAFSLVVSYREDGDGDYRWSAFEFMRLISAEEKMGFLAPRGQFAMFPPAEAHGHDISEFLLEANDKYVGDGRLGVAFLSDYFQLSAFLICTRKTDGTSIRVVDFHQIDDNSAGFAIQADGAGCIYFINGELFERYEGDALGYEMALQLYFDDSTGRVLGFAPSVFQTARETAASYMDPEIFHALLRSRLQDAASST